MWTGCSTEMYSTAHRAPPAPAVFPILLRQHVCARCSPSDGLVLRTQAQLQQAPSPRAAAPLRRCRLPPLRPSGVGGAGIDVAEAGGGHAQPDVRARVARGARNCSQNSSPSEIYVDVLVLACRMTGRASTARLRKRGPCATSRSSGTFARPSSSPRAWRTAAGASKHVDESGMGTRAPGAPFDTLNVVIRL